MSFPSVEKRDLLHYMKLHSANDLALHEEIFKWIIGQKEQTKSRTTNHSNEVHDELVACSLLLQRLARAFERRSKLPLAQEALNSNKSTISTQLRQPSVEKESSYSNRCSEAGASA